MNDRELIELAAKASGIYGEWHDFAGMDIRVGYQGGLHTDNGYWNPLEDNDDAFELSVSLGLSITPYPIYNSTERNSVIVKQRRQSDTLRETNPTEVVELYNGDPTAATRRAIVRSAAACYQE